jgi:hypothetical protein
MFSTLCQAIFHKNVKKFLRQPDIRAYRDILPLKAAGCMLIPWNSIT